MPVVSALERLGVAYQVGGSFASSIHGRGRSTMDVDLVADLEPSHVDAFVAAIGDGYYADAGMIREALRERSSFNLIHNATVFKVDVFVPKDRPYDREALARRARDRIEGHGGSGEVYVASAEDTILAKLEWFRLGGETSERQWNDVLGVLEVQGDALDRAYLERWASELGVAALLERALREIRE